MDGIRPNRKYRRECRLIDDPHIPNTLRLHACAGRVIEWALHTRALVTTNVPLSLGVRDRVAYLRTLHVNDISTQGTCLTRDAICL